MVKAGLVGGPHGAVPSLQAATPISTANNKRALLLGLGTQTLLVRATAEQRACLTAPARPPAPAWPRNRTASPAADGNTPSSTSAATARRRAARRPCRSARCTS